MTDKKLVPCCQYEYVDDKYPVFWNPLNGVVQCHVCGAQWEPIATVPANGLDKDNNVVDAIAFTNWLADEGKSFRRAYELGKRHMKHEIETVPYSEQSPDVLMERSEPLTNVHVGYYVVKPIAAQQSQVNAGGVSDIQAGYNFAGAAPIAAGQSPPSNPQNAVADDVTTSRATPAGSKRTGEDCCVPSSSLAQTVPVATLSDAEIERIGRDIRNSNYSYTQLERLCNQAKLANIQREPVAWTDGIIWENRQSEQILKLTREEQKQYGYDIPLFDLREVK